MSIEFSQIPERLNYPRHIKGQLSSLHSDVITYVSSIYDGSHELRSKTIRLLNTLTRYVIEGDNFPKDWSSKTNPFEGFNIEDEISLKENLDTLYINPKTVNWDIPVVVESAKTSNKVDQPSVPLVSSSPKLNTSKVKLNEETDKSDLYIQPPTVPQFDISKPWLSTVIDGTLYCIYSSVPEIPRKQNEISATTDVNLMTEVQLMNLYPKNFIRTRSPIMYEKNDSLFYHPQLGVILPIDGFTESQLIDNIIRYPHLFKLSKIKDGEQISFYSTIEISGQLHKVSDVWKDLPESRVIPYNADFVKEYVVRRYLLERDINHVNHKYPLFGTLDPFLTLFSTPSDYVKFGYKDVVDIARRCVQSRVSYKQSRNPVIRRARDHV